MAHLGNAHPDLVQSTKRPRLAAVFASALILCLRGCAVAPPNAESPATASITPGLASPVQGVDIKSLGIGGMSDQMTRYLQEGDYQKTGSVFFSVDRHAGLHQCQVSFGEVDSRPAQADSQVQRRRPLRHRAHIENRKRHGIELGVISTPNRQVNAVPFLASAKASFIAGANLAVTAARRHLLKFFISKRLPDPLRYRRHF